MEEVGSWSTYKMPIPMESPRWSFAIVMEEVGCWSTCKIPVSCLLTLRLHLNDCYFDSRPLFLVSLVLSLYIHINVYILLLLLYTIFSGTDKTGTGLSSG